MIQFCIRLAEFNIAITAFHSSTKDFCRNYLVSDEHCDFSVQVNKEDIAFEREKSYQEDILEGVSIRQFSDAYLETLAVYRQIAKKMLAYDVLLFHGSVISVDNIGYLFTAKSGTGKSTHTRLWREYFGSRAEMINDDKPLLKITRQGVIAYGTPWDGKHHLSTNKGVKLKAVCLLERSADNWIKPISKREATAMLLQQSYRPKEIDGMTKVLVLVDGLAESVNLYQLGCNQDSQAAEVAYQGMNERKDM